MIMFFNYRLPNIICEFRYFCQKQTKNQLPVYRSQHYPWMIPENVSATDGTLTYEIVDSASLRFREIKLVDNQGYSYTVKRRNNVGVT